MVVHGLSEAARESRARKGMVLEVTLCSTHTNEGCRTGSPVKPLMMLHAGILSYLACIESMACCPQNSKEAKIKVRDYIDRFTSWDPDTRVEQFSLLQFDWELASEKDKWAAVEERLEKALGLA